MKDEEKRHDTEGAKGKKSHEEGTNKPLLLIEMWVPVFVRDFARLFTP